MVSGASVLAGFGIGDAHGHAGQRMADRAGHAIAVIGVRGVHVGLGHAVALEHGVAGARRPFAMGVGEQRRRAGNEQPHVLRRLLGQRRALQQPRVERRHAHQHGGARHQLDDEIRIEFRQEDHRRAREQRDVAGHEQAVGVIDRQRVDQHVLVGEAPVIDQRERIRRQIVVRQHRALGAARGARGVEDRGEIVVGARRRFRIPPSPWRRPRVSDPLPSAPSVSTLAPTFAAIGADAIRLRRDRTPPATARRRR